MAKTFVVFDAAIGAIGKSDLNLSDTYRCYLLSAGWTPDYATSTMASISGAICTQLSASYTSGRGVGLCDWTQSAAGVWKFVPATDPVTFCATSGSNLSAQYAIVAASGAGATKAADPPLGYWEISTAEVVATQINLDFPADGLFDTSAADKTV